MLATGTRGHINSSHCNLEKSYPLFQQQWQRRQITRELSLPFPADPGSQGGKWRFVTG